MIALTGVTLAPLSTSCEKESIYQKLPPMKTSNPAPASMYGSLPRSGSGSGANTGAKKPPDYNTAMQRLSLAKNMSMNANVVKVGQQQSEMKREALNTGHLPRVPRQQLIAAVNPQIQVQPREQLVGHQEVKFNRDCPSSSSATLSHKSFPSVSCTDSGNGGTEYDLKSPSTAPSVLQDSQSQATQKDNHQNRQETHLQSHPSCLKSPSTSASHDSSNLRSLSQPDKRRDLHLQEFPAPSPTCISFPITHCIKSNNSPPRGKKRVSFSDQVELVGLEEEYLPNPLLERVLGKAFLANNNISN